MIVKKKEIIMPKFVPFTIVVKTKREDVLKNIGGDYYVDDRADIYGIWKVINNRYSLYQ